MAGNLKDIIGKIVTGETATGVGADAAGLSKVLGTFKGSIQELQNLGKDIDKLFTKDGRAAVSSMKTAMTDIGTAFKSMNPTDLTKAFSSTAKALDSALVGGIASISGAMSKALTAVFQLGSHWNSRIDAAKGSLDQAMMLVPNMIFDAAKQVGGPIGAAAQMAQDVMGSAVKALIFFREDDLTRLRARTAGGMQAGFGQTGQLNAMQSQQNTAMGYVGRDQAEKYATSMANAGLVASSQLMPSIMAMSLATGESAESMSKITRDMAQISSGPAEAMNRIKLSYSQMQTAAAGTNVSVKDMTKALFETASAARFMNTDMRVAGNTMAMIVKDANNLKSFGIDVNLDGGKMLKDLSGASKNLTDEMHVYFGTNRGKDATDPMKGWANSKYGAAFTESLTYDKENQKFSAATVGQNDMMISRMAMMKEAMTDAGSAATNEAERLYLENKAGKELFKLGDEAALLLSTKSLAELSALKNDPKIVNAMKDDHTLLGELQSTAVMQENLQRALHAVSIAQLKTLLTFPGFFEMMAASAAKQLGMDVDIEKHTMGASKFEEMIKNQREGTKLALKATLDIFGSLMDKETKEGFEAMGALFGKTKGKALGGTIPHYAGGTNSIVGERGMPELFGSGAAANLDGGLLMRGGEGGSVFNATATERIFSNAMSNQMNVSNKSMNGSASGGVTINLTVHMETMDREKFAQLLSDEVVRNIPM